MTNLNSEARELTNDEMNVVCGGGPNGGWMAIALNFLTDAIKGELKGEGFVATAANAAKQRM
jgi:hypothetical protein